MTRHTRRSPESGFAYFLALGFMAMTIILSMVVLMDMRTQGRRQREEQMIWRGNQFVSAIKHYYRRTGHYPQNLDDLQKGVANLHFLRQAALFDPMNKDGDGKWRFIYVNASGQIFGSTRYATLQQMAILDMNGSKPRLSGDSSDQDSDQGSATSNLNCPQPGQPGLSNPNATSTQFSSQLPGSALGAGLGSTSFLGQGQNMSPGQLGSQPGSQPGFGSSFSLGQNQSPGQNQSSGQDQPGTTATTCRALGTMGMTPAALQALMDLKPSGPVDGPVIGGMLVGVGSTVDRSSVKVYKGAKKYNEWEFIWNPIEEQALALQQGINQTGVLGGLGALGQGIGLPGPGTTSTGGVGSSPIQAPPTTQMPQPSQPQQQ